MKFYLTFFIGLSFSVAIAQSRVNRATKEQSKVVIYSKEETIKNEKMVVTPSNAIIDTIQGRKGKSQVSKEKMYDKGKYAEATTYKNKLAFVDTVFIRGTIIDNDKQPLPGVSIAVKGKTRGTTSDMNGNFRIKVLETDILIITYIGYSNKELPVGRGFGVLPFTYNITNGNVYFNATTQKMNSSIPAFHLPPPQPSADTDLDKNLFKSAKYLKDVDVTLTAALQKAGWGDRHYYQLIKDNQSLDGFAMIAQPEQIKEDGTPQEGDKRWELKLDTWKKGDFWDYIKSMFRTKEGHFKLIVFIISKTEISPSDEKLEFQKAMGWFMKGCTGLPESIGNVDYTDKFNCAALIYEFEQIGDQKEPKLIANNTSTEIYLKKSNIWQALNSK